MMNAIKSSLIAGVFGLMANVAGAQELTGSMTVSGAESGSYSVTTTRNTINSDRQGRYMSVEIFADGVDAGRTRCGTADFYEVDFFFGQDTTFGGHVLFSLQRTGAGYVAIEPAVFFDVYNARGELVETYADYDNAQIALTSLGCAANGQVEMAIQYKGRALSDEGFGNARVQISGTASGAAILRDMDDY